MAAVKKLTLGIQTENKAFRVDSLWGILVDTILDARGKEIPDTYYTQVAESNKNGFISMLNEKEGNTLLITRENVAFTKSAYPNGHVDLDKAFVEFKKIWDVIQKVMKLKGIRRIGIVAEHRFDAITNNNLELLSRLTTMPHRDFPAHFSLHYESRTPARAGEVIDVAKSGFTNAIYDFYDSSLDTAVPLEGKINANLDYQRYFGPSLDARITEAMETHFYEFKKELKTFDGELAKLGLKK